MLTTLSAYIVPILIITLLVYATVLKKNSYTSFVFGAKTSFDLVLISFPYIVAIFMAIEVFVASGLSQSFANFLSPLFSFLGVPIELTELIIIKPFSGCGSLAVLENIYNTYGVDSYLARAGSVIAGSSEALFYVAAVYFSKTKITKFSYGIAVALVANFIGIVFACFITKFI